jgi:SpoVK/Ycf46/Vps4 family AAA+-type ATPase
LPKEEKETLFRLVLSQRNGLTILLHGGPGTGKTFTATCIAEKIKRPLLLGSVEIGRSIADVEQSLSQSFELAERWGAILLLEDVDSLLARRQAGQSSDLAATFTKVIQAIDKCSGVLFLTTCRVGVLDEAILSRIDYTVQYKPLSNKTLNEFWNMALLDESEDPITLDILDNLKEWEQLDGYEYLNGRDIQAIVLTARQMASVQGKLLGVRELEPILKARIDFARYMIRVRGGHTANEEAQRMRYRSDEPGKVDWD